MRWMAAGMVWVLSAGAVAQGPATARPKFEAFETVKRADPNARAGRFFKMTGAHRWMPR